MDVSGEARVVRGDGVVLAAFVPDDLDALRLAFADEQIAAWNPGPLDDDGILGWLQRRNAWDGRHASWAVRGVDGELLGSVSLHSVDTDQLDAEIGYWVGPWARGAGVARRAVGAALGFGFTELRLHRVYLYHAADNVPSCVVATRAGLRLEGVLREAFRYGDGRYHDEHLHAVLAHELVGPGAHPRAAQDADVPGADSSLSGSSSPAGTSRASRLPGGASGQAQAGS